MKRSISKFLKIALPLALGIFLIFWSYSRFTPEQLAEIKIHFQAADYTFVVLAVVLSILSHIFRAVRWNLMLAPLGYQPKLLNNFMAISIAYLMNIFIPKSGEVSRGIVINKYEEVPFDKAFGTIISERVIDLVFLLGFTLLALWLQYDILYEYLTNLIPVTKLLYVLAAMLAFGILFIVFLKYSRSALQQKIKGFISGLRDGVFSIFKMKKKGLFLLQTCIIWGLYLLSFYVALFALEATSRIAMGTIIITFVVGSFSFAFTNSGFGSYPFFVAGILAVFGVAETVGTAFGWIVWTSNIVTLIVFGGLSLLFLPLYNQKSV